MAVTVNQHKGPWWVCRDHHGKEEKELCPSIAEVQAVSTRNAVCTTSLITRTESKSVSQPRPQIRRKRGGSCKPRSARSLRVVLLVQKPDGSRSRISKKDSSVITQ